MLNLIALVVFSQIHHFDFAAIPSSQTAGTPFQITCYARDSLGNVVTTFNNPARIYATPGIQYGNLDVVFNSGIWQGNFTATLTGTYTLSCQDYSTPPHTGESNAVTFSVGSPYRLLILVPGQTYYPGIDTGKTGTPIPQAAGISFDASVYLTDQWCNLISSRTDSCQLSSSDPFSSSNGFSLVNGQATVPYSFRTANQQVLYVRDITAPSIRGDTSSNITVNAGPYGKLLALLPGESHIPGDSVTSTLNTPGKLNVPDDQYEGVDFTVTVYATDTCWNRTYTNGNQVQILSDFQFSNPAPQTLNNGEALFSLNFTEIGRVMLWAEDINTGYDSYNNYLNILAVIDTSVVTDSFLVYPNPMGIESNTMVFAYYLPSASNISFEIYDPFGNLVLKRDWAAGSANAQVGMNRFTWNGHNDRNVRVASGVYYTIIKAWTHTSTIFKKKLTVGVVW